MKAFPLPFLSWEEAKARQFSLVEAIARQFSGHEVLQGGDRGVGGEQRKPQQTVKVENVLAAWLGAEAAVLVQGAGTGAIYWALQAVLHENRRILVHQAPIYPTTRTTLENLGAAIFAADFHDWEAIVKAVEAEQPAAILVQHTRQTLRDSYQMEPLIGRLKKRWPHLPIVVDDNYAVLKVPAIGIQCGADLSAFSLFKLLGPEGVGVVVGKAEYIAAIAKQQYSGGSKIQGPVAMEVLQGLVQAPLLLALQGEVVQEVAEALQQGAIAEIGEAIVANAQSRVVLAKLRQPIAAAVIKAANSLGAASHPVGAESKYEMTPLICQASYTLLADQPDLQPYVLRINPMRASAATVLRILREAIALAQSSGR